MCYITPITSERDIKCHRKKLTLELQNRDLETKTDIWQNCGYLPINTKFGDKTKVCEYFFRSIVQIPLKRTFPQISVKHKAVGFGNDGFRRYKKQIFGNKIMNFANKIQISLTKHHQKA